MLKQYNQVQGVDEKVAIKHSSAIYISAKISLFQRKDFNVLLALAFNDLEKQNNYHKRTTTRADTANY